jgi:parallel beta-helix repeat protein
MQTGCADLVVSHNKVSFANSYGIQSVNGQRIRIEGNTVSDCSFHGIGLTAGASGCVVKDNESFRSIYPPNRQANGIYVYGSTGNTICGNRLHDNQDTGLQFSGAANDNVAFNNRSWANGDHGYDHLASTGVTHVNDVAYGNVMDGFSFEGNSSGGQLHNSIAVDNGLTRNEFDLWVDASSFVGFGSDYNLFWNSTTQAPVKIDATSYATLGAYQGLGQDAHSKQGDPRFVNGAAADFRLLGGSPAIDAGTSSVPNWPAMDAAGGARMDDLLTANTGAGPVAFGDMGVFEFVPPVIVPRDKGIVVTAPGSVKAVNGQTLTFTITAADSDGDAIQSLTMVPIKMPANSGATFTPNATKTGGTFTWAVGTATGKFQVQFVATNALTATATTNIQVVKKSTTGEEEAIGRPVLAMSQASPNPSMGDVNFTLDLPEASDVDLSVYDMQGRRVWQETRSLSAGRSSLSWNGLSANRQRVGTGMYFVRAQVGGTVLLRRVVRF